MWDAWDKDKTMLWLVGSPERERGCLEGIGRMMILK